MEERTVLEVLTQHAPELAKKIKNGVWGCCLSCPLSVDDTFNIILSLQRAETGPREEFELKLVLDNVVPSRKE